MSLFFYTFRCDNIISATSMYNFLPKGLDVWKKFVTSQKTGCYEVFSNGQGQYFVPGDRGSAQGDGVIL